jgi:hypothetical protein
VGRHAGLRTAAEETNTQVNFPVISPFILVSLEPRVPFRYLHSHARSQHCSFLFLINFPIVLIYVVVRNGRR